MWIVPREPAADDLEAIEETRYWQAVPNLRERLADAEAAIERGEVYSMDQVRTELGLPLLSSSALPRLQSAGQGFRTILADPPWRFTNRTGKVAPEHRRLSRYDTMTTEAIMALPVPDIVADTAHLYLWVPNALLADGLAVMNAWGFGYKSNLVWHKIRKDGESDGRGVGFYFRNVTELVLFGVRGHMRTLDPGRRQVNLFSSRKREHSRKPDELYEIIEACSPGPYLELFARYARPTWTAWGLEADPDVRPRGQQYPAYR